MNTRDDEEQDKLKFVEKDETILYSVAPQTEQYKFCLQTRFWLFMWACGQLGLFVVSMEIPQMMEKQQKQLLQQIIIFGIVLGVNIFTFLYNSQAKSGILGYILTILLILSTIFALQSVSSYLIIQYPLYFPYLLVYMAIFYIVQAVHMMTLGDQAGKQWPYWIFLGVLTLLFTLIVANYGNIKLELDLINTVLFLILMFMFLLVMWIDANRLLSGVKNKSLRIDEVPYSIFLSIITILCWPVLQFNIVMELLGTKLEQ